MPKVYRVMKKDPADDLPVVGSTNSSELGARPGHDIQVDEAGLVVLDGSGMSVVPNWRDLPFNRIPKRLNHLIPIPGATGSPSRFCFSMGRGPFESGDIASGLILVPDPPLDPVTHGAIAPKQAVVTDQYQTDLANTRLTWRVDET